jgi:hypothetical protein
VHWNLQNRSLLTVVSHFCTWSGIICEFWKSSREFLDPVVNYCTQQTLPTINRKHFFINILYVESVCAQKMHNRTLLFGSILIKHSCHFDYWNQPQHTRLLPRLSWSRTVLLPCDTHRNLVTSIMAVLLQFVTCLLTLPCMRPNSLISVQCLV